MADKISEIVKRPILSPFPDAYEGRGKICAHIVFQKLKWLSCM